MEASELGPAPYAFLALRCSLAALPVTDTNFSAPLPTPQPAALHPSLPLPQAEAQRTQDVRAAYRRALAVPTGALDALWGDYERFEEMARCVVMDTRHLSLAGKIYMRPERYSTFS